MTILRERGFSLVEVMVAMLIGLIGTIIIFQVFAISEAQKRSTTGVSDAQQNGLLALFTLEREARLSGYGVNYEPLLGCTVRAYDGGPPVRGDFTFTLAAVQITNGAGGAPDSLTFVYGSSNLSVQPAKLYSASNAASAMTQVDNRFGYLKNDLILLGELSKDCTLRMISNLPTGGAGDLQIEHNAGRYNKGGGIPVGYSTWDNTANSGGRLYSLGAAPQVVTYSIANATLQEVNLLTGNTPSPLIDGIVQLQAEYGKDTDAVPDGTVDTWNNVTPTNAAEWASVIAVRIAVVARSGTPEKPNPTTFACDVTTTPPTWKGGTQISLAADADWQCYRYRTFETVVPIRNLIWKPE